MQVAAGAQVDADMLHAARKRTQMIVSETGDRATVAEATDAELKKFNHDGAEPFQLPVLPTIPIYFLVPLICWFPSLLQLLLAQGR